MAMTATDVSAITKPWHIEYKVDVALCPFKNPPTSNHVMETSTTRVITG